MPFTVQNDRGTVDAANSYVDVATMKDYYTTRGVDLSSYTDDRITQALVAATDCMDARYAFIGVPLRANQGTACPRYLPEGDDGKRYPQDFATLEPGYLLKAAQWKAILNATCQLAYRELKKPGGLMPDPTFDASGQRIAKKTTKAGPVESIVEYAQFTGSDKMIPSFPAVDMLLKNTGVLRSRSNGALARG